MHVTAKCQERITKDARPLGQLAQPGKDAWARAGEIHHTGEPARLGSSRRLHESGELLADDHGSLGTSLAVSA